MDAKGPKLRAAQLDALKIAFKYALIGALWIMLSDTVVERLIHSEPVELVVEVLKGWIFIGATAIFIFWQVYQTLHQRTEMLRREDAQRTRFVRQRQALLDCSRLHVRSEADLDGVLECITSSMAETLEVSRVGMWLYNDDRSLLICATMTDRDRGQRSSGAALEAARYPHYFKALTEGDIVDADDAVHDPRTAEFSEDYLKPLGISSMMDATISVGGEVRGVLCCEHVGEPRHWAADEESFSVAMGGQVAMAIEAAQRCEAEQQLREAQDNLQRAVQAGKVGLWDWDLEADQLRLSAEALQQLGYDKGDVIPSPFDVWASRIHPDDRDRAVECMRKYMQEGVGSYHQEYRVAAADGTYRWILCQGEAERNAEGKVVRLRGSRVDITEQKLLEEQFIQAQKMETVGRLAGGVAHDFNNLLTVILGYCQLTLDEMEQSHPLYGNLVEVYRAAQRASDLTRQLLAFSRRQILQPEIISPNKIVLDMEKMLRRLIGEDISLQVELDEKVGDIRADPGQMTQVVMNLVVNARDAMPGGGTLTIRTSGAKLDNNFNVSGGFLPPGEYACIAVSDTGTGMSKEVQAKIFEPFFTTKELGKGTGLGLSMVDGIVKQSGGALSVESTPGEGSTFRVFVPLSRQLAAPAPSSSAELNPEPGKGTVLVVEDQDALRQLVQAILSSDGYRVLTAANAQAALHMLGNSSMQVDLLLSDVVMPGMNGVELAREMKARLPHLRVLYMSGYSELPLLEQANLDPARLLTKPFSNAQLRAKVREALSAPG